MNHLMPSQYIISGFYPTNCSGSSALFFRYLETMRNDCDPPTTRPRKAGYQRREERTDGDIFCPRMLNCATKSALLSNIYQKASRLKVNRRQDHHPLVSVKDVEAIPTK
ncbi:hypothetical protein BS17DRAFT_783544 [Gyrodon lividus]|nr:hypothetical protein BS17DRAFT_783544 [Gyrodon lividus]